MSSILPESSVYDDESTEPYAMTMSEFELSPQEKKEEMSQEILISSIGVQEVILLNSMQLLEYILFGRFLFMIKIFSFLFLIISRICWTKLSF